MSDFSLNLVVQKVDKKLNDMANVLTKFQEITSFGGFFFVEDQFKRLVMPHVDEFLGRRSQSVGYQYSEILLTMAGNFFCGGNRAEDINVLKSKMPQHPTFRLCSPDTVLRAMTELAEEDKVYSTAEGKAYRFNTAQKLNALLVYVAVKSGMLHLGHKYDLDFDHEFLESETWEALPTYKGFKGYGPGCAVLTDIKDGTEVIAGIENRDGNTPVKFRQEDTLNRILLNIIEQGIKIRSARVDCGSYKESVINLLLEHCETIYVRAAMNKGLRRKLQNENRVWRVTTVGEQQMEVLSIPFDGFSGRVGHCRLVVQRKPKKAGTQLDMFEDGGDDTFVYRAILTNNWDMSEEEVIGFYNQRGAKEKLFDQMDNDFGWHYLPKGTLRENTVFMILTAIIRNFYCLLLQNSKLRAFGVYATTRMKAFINRVVSVAAKWTRSSRTDILCIYTQNCLEYTELYADYG